MLSSTSCTGTAEMTFHSGQPVGQRARAGGTQGRTDCTYSAAACATNQGAHNCHHNLHELPIGSPQGQRGPSTHTPRTWQHNTGIAATASTGNNEAIYACPDFSSSHKQLYTHNSTKTQSYLGPIKLSWPYPKFALWALASSEVLCQSICSLTGVFSPGWARAC
jgi:hypothetical protein